MIGSRTNHNISGQVRCSVIRRSSASPRPPRDSILSASVWPSPRHRPQAHHASIPQIGFHLMEPRSLWTSPQHDHAPRISTKTIRSAGSSYFQSYISRCSIITEDKNSLCFTRDHDQPDDGHTEMCTMSKLYKRGSTRLWHDIHCSEPIAKIFFCQFG